jgi:hypothetical protein
MANVTDPSAVLFCNGQVRPGADKTMQFYWWMKALKQEYLANPNLATLLPNDATALVVDGSATDGRTPITGADVQLFLTNINTFITSLEANSSALLNNFAKISVNPRP